MIENIKFWVSVGIAVVNFAIALIVFVKNIITKVKAKDWESLKQELKNELIPLMEQAERFLKDPTEKEEWVLKKLAEKVHIDFFKYKNILELAKTIIAEICETTKIEVNKTIVKIDKKENVESGVYKTNGIS